MAPKSGFRSLKDIVNPSVASNLNEQSGVGDSAPTDNQPATPAPAENAAAPVQSQKTTPAAPDQPQKATPAATYQTVDGERLELSDEEIRNNPGINTPWQQFIEYAEEYYKDTDKTRGVTVWIDDDVKDVLDKIKASGEVRVPVRHMVSSMCRIFIEENKDDIIQALTKSKRKNSLL